MKTAPNRRILLIDDTPAIHQDFRKILVPASPRRAEVSAAEAALFGNEALPAADAFELDSAYQGQEGLAMLQRSMDAGQPYAVAFVDMRMPPGWDGAQTIEQLWRTDPRLQVVICTAYADHSWNDVLTRLDARDRLLILKKPFDAIEVLQLATTLTAKWHATRQAAEQLGLLEQAVRERTAEITRTNQALQAEVDERKHLQSQLVQSEKMASIGQLAAGIAHEINNPIGYIFSNFGTLKEYLDKLFEMLTAYQGAERCVAIAEVAGNLRDLREQVDLDFLKQDIPMLLQESMQGVHRVRQIVQDLRDFSRVDSTQEWERADLHRGIDSTLNLVACQIKDNADVVKEYAAIPPVECLPSHINQVVLNLVINAAQSIGEERGRITIRTGTEDDHVWFEVEDTGIGMSKDVINRIFEPFFTTRPIGTGTGLGLSLSYGIVQKHQGRIDVTSEVGVGSKFRVWLPVRQQHVPDDTDGT